MQKRIEHDGLTTHILDLLTSWHFVDARRMFGGCGLFLHGTMFALILDETLYLKDSLDDRGQPVKTSFEKEYFEYARQNKTVRLNYFKAPDRALEEGNYLIELAKASYQSALLKKRITKSKTKINTKFKTPLAITKAKTSSSKARTKSSPTKAKPKSSSRK